MTGRHQFWSTLALILCLAVTPVLAGSVGRSAGSQTDPGPSAAFGYSPSEPVAGTPVTFDASSSSSPNGTIVSYAWDFDGDNTTDATGREVTHTFERVGNTTVTLIVTDANGRTYTRAATVTVGPGVSVTANYTVSRRTIPVGDPLVVNVTAQNQGGDGTANLTLYVDGR